MIYIYILKKGAILQSQFVQSVVEHIFMKKMYVQNVDLNQI